MMQTLIGADGVVMTLSGRIEITSQDQRTVIEGHPGVGIKPQRIVLDRLRILDVETLPEAARPLVTVEHNWDETHASDCAVWVHERCDCVTGRPDRLTGADGRLA